MNEGEKLSPYIFLQCQLFVMAALPGQTDVHFFCKEFLCHLFVAL